ncbi:MAG: hypothetical protein PHW22_00180 [Bacilli bacterium]|nr:hypothetical protein [Bacilli bacterium]
MIKRNQAKLIKFNWRDIVAIVTVVAITATVFVWTLFVMPSASQNVDTYLLARYHNDVIFQNLPVRDGPTSLEYVISFRRDLRVNETYTNTYKEGEIKNIEATNLADVTSPSEVDGYYLIVNSTSDDVFNGFRDLVGPQVDVKVFNMGFQVILEDSPENVCSKQGFTDNANVPVVCLPNSMFFWLASNSYDGPDA